MSLGLAFFFAEKLTNDHVSLHKFMCPARDGRSNVTRARYPRDTLRDILVEYDQSPVTLKESSALARMVWV